MQTRRRSRENESAFVAEGVRLVEEALSAGWPIETLFFDETLSERGQRLIAACRPDGVGEVIEIDTALMAELSDTDNPQGILAILSRKPLPLPPNPTFIVVADQIRDPGNLGTLLRTAEAAGADAVLLAPETVDAFSPKVVRAAMGAHFHLPTQHQSWVDIAAYVQGIPVYLATANAEMTLWDADFTQPCALLIGGEAFGASEQGSKTATHTVAIPMQGRAESLNAAIAAAILMAEVLRQRSSPRKD